MYPRADEVAAGAPQYFRPMCHNAMVSIYYVSRPQS
jgi:hypothetical protein